MMAIFLLVLVTLIAFEVAMTVSMAEVALKKQSDVEKIVAEGDSVSLCNIDQMYINMIEISEAVRKGDSGHSIKIVLVPTDSLIFEVAYGLDYSNGSAIVKDLPIINEIYVYLNKGSQMHFTVWIGNGNKAKSASLYIFNDADKLNDYISYGSVDSPVFTSEIPVEGKNKIDITQKYGLHIGYYFLIPLGRNGSFECQWEHNGVPVTDQVFIEDATRTSILNIDQVLQSNEGNYTCTANNSAGSSSQKRVHLSLAGT